MVFSFQMNGKGQLIPEEETLYVWMDSYGAGPSDNYEFKVQISPVLNTFSWTKFLDVALPVFNINFYQSVMMMAGAIACFHYPYSILIAGKLCMFKLSHSKKTFTTTHCTCRSFSAFCKQNFNALERNVSMTFDTHCQLQVTGLYVTSYL